MNWGGFAGGFSQGFSNGVSMGKTLSDAIKQKKIEDVRAKGIEEARGMQEAAVAGMVKENGIEPQKTTTPADASVATVTPDTRDVAPANQVATVDVNPGQPTGVPAIAAQTGVTPAKRFTVGDQGFDTREQAMEAARKKAPSVMDFMGKTLVPRMQEVYMAQGDVEKAEAWGQWAEQRQSKKAMAEWAGAWRAASMGNIEKAADHVFNLYKTYDDGITPLSKEIVKDKDGNITGFNVRLKTDSTGEERTQFIDRSALTEMGLSALSPPQMFEQAYRRQAEVDKMRAQTAAELAKEGRAEAREIAKEGRADAREVAKETRGEARDVRKAARDQGYALEKISIEEQLKQAGATNKVKQEVNAKVDFLRKSGYSDEFINDALPNIIGLGDFKKKTSPEEARRLAFSDRMKSDPTFARKSAADQQTILDQDMKLIFGGVDPKTAPSPAASGLPPKPAGQGVPVYDTKTGTIVYR